MNMSIYVRACKYTDTYEFTHLNQTSLVDFGGEQLVIGKTKVITTLQTNVYIHQLNSNQIISDVRTCAMND